MSTAAELTGAIRERLERRLRHLPPARRLRFLLALRSLDSFADGRPLRILDAGAGDGLLSLAVAERYPGSTVVAADLREEALERGRRDADRDGVRNVRFEPIDVTRPIPDGGYDVVLALECLEEISDDEAATAAFAGALRPGGLLLVHVPERDWQPVLRSSEPTWKDQVRHGYSRDELVALLERQGLQVDRVTATTRGTVKLAQEVRDRIKSARLAVRALAYPPLTAALWLERLGLTWGPARALYAEARKPA
jgi:SAM-dependent methyltransferase